MKIQWSIVHSPTTRPGKSYNDAWAWRTWNGRKGEVRLALAVADGVGSGSRRAALAAVAGLVAALSPDSKGIADAFARAVDAVAPTGAATTLTGGLFVIHPTWSTCAAAIAHAGDSRAWLVPAVGHATKLTRDENLAGALAHAGAIRPEEVDEHPGARVLLNALGHPEQRCVPHFELRLVKPGERLVLCTDGCNEAGLPRLAGQEDPRLAATRLVLAARAAGSTDDATAAVIDVL